MREIRYITLRKRIEIDGQERDRLTVRNRKRGTQRRLVPDCQEHVDLARRELAIVRFVAFDIRCLDVIECKIPAFLIAEFGHPLEEIRIMRGLSRLHTDKADTQHLWLLLRARREWPCSRGAAEDSDEIAASHVRRTRQPRFDHSTAPCDRDADAGPCRCVRGDSPTAGPSPAEAMRRAP